MLFRQFRDTRSRSCTYLLADTEAREAMVIDPVPENLDVLLAVAGELWLRAILLTHAHAGSRDGAVTLREHTGAPLVVSSACQEIDGDDRVDHLDYRVFGSEVVHVIGTPGCTPCSVCYRWRNRLFTGNTLPIGRCGTDEVGAEDAGRLFDSVTGRLFELPPETLVYPSRDLGGRTVSSIAEEKSLNFHFGGREEFVTLMAQRRCSRPSMET